jgi:AcrR family transcriptional regulator
MVEKIHLKQKRAVATYESIIDSAAKLFASRGYEQTQTHDIAKDAGVSPGALYRYFDDKHVLLMEVLRRHLAAGRAAVDAQLRPERFAGTGRREAISVVLNVLIERVREDVGLARVYLTMSLTDPAVASLRAAQEAEERNTVGHLIAALIPHAIVPNPEAAALLLQMFGLEIACERAGLRPRAGAPIADADMTHAACDVIHRYLFPEPAAVAPKKSTRAVKP